MKQKVSLAHLVEGGFKGIYQVSGQLTDETYCITEQEREVFDDDLLHRGIERSKELVFGKHLALGQEIHQRALAHVGITHERHTD